MPLLRKKNPKLFKNNKISEEIISIFIWSQSYSDQYAYFFPRKKYWNSYQSPITWNANGNTFNLIWNLLKNNTLTAAEFQMQTGLVSSWSNSQYQWMRLTNSIAATPPHRHKICFKDSLKKKPIINGCFSELLIMHL